MGSDVRSDVRSDEVKIPDPTYQKYPYFNGVQFGICNRTAAGEFMLSKSISLVPSVKIPSQSFAVEFRKYFDGPVQEKLGCKGFLSLRLSTRSNFGIGFGMTDGADKFSCTPTFGVSFNKEMQATPFISVLFGWF